MTDHYSVIELATRNLATSQLTSYFPSASAARQVTKSDDTVYDEGYDYYLTTYPGAFPVERAGVQTIAVTWEIIIDLLTRWGAGGNANDKDTWDAFIAYRSDVFNLYNATLIGRNLNRTAGVQRVTLAAEDRPRYIGLDADNVDAPPAFIAQACILNVVEIINKS